MDVDDKQLEEEFEEQLNLEKMNTKETVLLKQQNRKLQDQVKLLESKLAKQTERQQEIKETDRNSSQASTSYQNKKTKGSNEEIDKSTQADKENVRKRGTRAGKSRWDYTRGRGGRGRGVRGRSGRSRGINVYFFSY